ncbi:uncharacterized protein LTHEOB_12917, partial [Neofusicoccum parvum]
MGRKQAELIGSEVRGWRGLIASPSQLEVLAHQQQQEQEEEEEVVVLLQPIAELPLFEDGLLCRKDPGSGSKKGGGSGKGKEETAERRFQEMARPVYCQRFFPTFHGSQYFEVCRPEPEQEQEAQQEDQAQQPAQGGEQLWQQAWNKANQNWEELEKRARATIEEGE